MSELHPIHLNSGTPCEPAGAGAHPVEGRKLGLLNKPIPLSLKDVLQQLGVAQPEPVLPVAAVPDDWALQHGHMLLLHPVPAQARHHIWPYIIPGVSLSCSVRLNENIGLKATLASPLQCCQLSSVPRQQAGSRR